MSIIHRPDDRRCTHVSATGIRCITVLCRLNPGPECFVHWPDDKRPSVQEREVAAVAEFKLLMCQHEGRIAA